MAKKAYFRTKIPEMKKTVTSFFAFCVAAVALCNGNCPLPDPERSPEMIADGITEWTVSGVAFGNSDFSGLCFSRDDARMVAAFNSAAIYWLDIPVEGEPLKFEPFEVEGSGFRVQARDCECITLNRNTGDIYFGQERDSKDHNGSSVYRIKAPGYNTEELVITLPAEITGGGNSGIEGLTWLSDDNLIIGIEGKWSRKTMSRTAVPTMIFYSESKGITGSVAVPQEIKQIAEIVYDDVRDCVWILDGDYDKVLYRCTLKGEVMDRYPIPGIKNAEALLLDRTRGCIWIGSDETPSKLYRIPFRNL